MTVALHYLDVTGRAEPIRCALVAGGVGFEDKRYSLSEAADKLKPLSPTRKIPILEVDGRMYAESHAILTYLCTLAGMVSSDPLEMLAHNMIMERLEARLTYLCPLYKADKEQRAKLLPLAAADLRGFLSVFDEMLDKYAGEPTHVLKGKPYCPADLIIYCMVKDILDNEVDVGDLAATYPSVYAIYQGVLDSNPSIKTYHQHGKSSGDSTSV
eukprot:Blabericola_migrator_1__6606@NODE_3333_length_1849_cov_439_478114_g2084_i0_p2_GENE_NODE_3333_length_1849_cov_439_478114_g2084_i0NODE_3333_length_1849_cov_439_478114_g2084_i0_p2_ORF_typecomplete_len213_score27_43GST_N/PF02798_20/1_3e11GST_N_3/PF13417_6/1_1e07Tom37/PF10568_9/0_011GST_N_4/PF17172_4/0_036_NODE_3333_length_1849_cov_439_478114_g2084_i035673